MMMGFVVKWSNGQMFWGDIPLDDEQILDLRKALVEAVADGMGESGDFHVEDEGDEGFRCDFCGGGPETQIREGFFWELSAWLTPQSVMAYLLATRKLHLSLEFGFATVDEISEANALDAIKDDTFFSIPEPEASAT